MKSLCSDFFFGEFYQIFKKNCISFIQSLPKHRQEGILSNSFYRASINSDTKTRKKQKQKQNKHKIIFSYPSWTWIENYFLKIANQIEQLI